MTATLDFDGVVPALTTPFDRAGKVDPEALAGNLRRLAVTGIGGVLVLGSTGEAVLLDPGERLRVVEAARAATPGGMPLLVGVDAQSTGGAIAQARGAAAAGADAVLVLTPFYYRDRMDGPALERHYAAVADASPAPVLLYSVPKFTGLTLPVEVAVHLSGHPRIAGIKDSAGDPVALAEVVQGSAPGFAVFCGHAGTVAPALAAGARGAILAAATAVPEPFVRLHSLARAGRAVEAAELQTAAAELAAAIAGTAGVAGVKAALDLRGLAGGAPRPPLTPLAAEERAVLAAALQRGLGAGLLPALAL